MKLINEEIISQTVKRLTRGTPLLQLSASGIPTWHRRKVGVFFLMDSLLCIKKLPLVSGIQENQIQSPALMEMEPPGTCSGVPSLWDLTPDDLRIELME